MTYTQAIQILILLYRAGLISGFSLVHFTSNLGVQFFITGLATVDPGAPISEPFGMYLTYVAEYISKAQKDQLVERVAQISVWTGAMIVTATVTPPEEVDQNLAKILITALNAGVGSSNAAIMTYLKAILELTNKNDVPFILNYKHDQKEVYIFLGALGFSIILIYSYIRLCKYAFKFGFNFAERENQKCFIKNNYDQ